MTNYIAALVDELYQLGVREVVISPGSRSTPLSMLFCERGFKSFLNVDERSAGFFALGAAKGLERPVALVCTSGSAAAHYLPAIIEARYSRVPLIVLTADRPHELRHVGAPQTIDQNKLFGVFVKYEEELALPEDRESMYRYVRVVMQKSYATALEKPYGAVHINVPVRDPLIPRSDVLDFSVGRSKDKFELITGENSFSFDSSALKDKNGLIICGGDAYSDYQMEVVALGDRLKAPVLADPISNVRNYAKEIIIDSYDAFLKSDAVKKELRPDFIIHFGQTPVSKRLQQFLSMHREAFYLQVGEGFEYRNPSLSTKKYFVSSPRVFAESVRVQNEHMEYLSTWLSYQKQMRKQLNSAKDEINLFEGRIVQMIQDMLWKNSWLAVANSMAIRDVDYFFEARDQRVKILCNRGANGIDGSVSTALGLSAAGHPTVLLTGDLAFYHDLNGLLISKTHPLNLIIVLLNNDGGGIFQYLPQSKEPRFEYLFRTPHGIDFRGTELLYDIKYAEADDYRSFAEAFSQAMAMTGIRLIEIKIDLALSKALHDQYTTLQVPEC